MANGRRSGPAVAAHDDLTGHRRSFTQGMRTTMQVIQGRAGPHLNSMWSPIAHYPTPTRRPRRPRPRHLPEASDPFVMGIGPLCSGIDALATRGAGRAEPVAACRHPRGACAPLTRMNRRPGAARRCARSVSCEPKSDRGAHRRAGPVFDEDARAARLAAHRGNLERYRRILTTPLTDLERAFVKRRMAEELAQIDRLEHRALRGSVGVDATPSPMAKKPDDRKPGGRNGEDGMDLHRHVKASR